MPPDSVVVDVIEDGQALVDGLGLRTAVSPRGPEAAASGDGLGAAVLPEESAAVAKREGSSPRYTL